MTVFAVVNQKGGVGKTAVTLGLACAIARLGAKTLIVDLDPQSTATGVVEAEFKHSKAGTEVSMTTLMLADAVLPVRSVVVPTKWGFDIAPSTITLAKREQARVAGIEYRLRLILEDNGYDIVLVDCSPSLGLLVDNALIAADQVLIVAAPSYASMRGLRDLYLGEEIEVEGEKVHRDSTIETIKKYYNNDLQVAGVIANMVDGTNDAKNHLEELRKVFGDTVWTPSIPRRIAMANSNTRHVPLHELSPSEGGARSVVLALEVLAKRLLESANFNSGAAKKEAL